MKKQNSLKTEQASEVRYGRNVEIIKPRIFWTVINMLRPLMEKDYMQGWIM